VTFSLLVLPAFLLVLGFPVFVVLLAAATSAIVFFMDLPLAALHQSMFGVVDAFALLAIPFFIYAGELMGRGSVARRIVAVVNESTGPVCGKVGLTTIGTNAIFGAISGSAPATVATVGKLMLPSLRKAQYPEHVSAGLLASAGTIDILIPPSIPLLIYGVAANESVPRLYAAGLVPAFIVAGLTAVYIMWVARREGIADGTPFSLARLLAALRASFFALLPPVVILGGIYGGVFSPTEAAGIACVISALVTRYIYRDLTWGDILDIARQTSFVTAQIMIILAAAGVFAWVLTVNQIPQVLANHLQALNLAKWLLLLAVNIIFLLIGMVLDPIAAILVVTPLVVPIMKTAGVDMVHFGVIVSLNLALGLFHPPFGLNMFVVQSAFRFPLRVIIRGIWPVLGVQLLALVIVTYVPTVSLWLPNLIFG
jgi:C4-dicarboxylate transporter, DctM subunit